MGDFGVKLGLAPVKVERDSNSNKIAHIVLAPILCPFYPRVEFLWCIVLLFDRNLLYESLEDLVAARQI